MPRPDDGLIHAWLDGQLPPEEAARIEALAATDPAWAAAVAEARGLVAASSRILSALDHVPAGVVPMGKGARTTRRLPWWTKVAAAVVVVVGGSVVVVQNVPDGRLPAPSTGQGSAQSASGTPTTVVPAPTTPLSAQPPVATARMPAAASAAGAPSDAGAGTRNARAPRQEALATQSLTSPAAPAPALVAGERKAAQDVGGAATEVSVAKSLETKVAGRVAPPAAPSIEPQAQQAASLGFTQAQNTLPSRRAVAGVSATQDAMQQQQKQQLQQESPCYRVVADSANGRVAVIMRAVRTDGDTLRLVPVESSDLTRAWIVRRDGFWSGATVGIPSGRDALPVVASRIACPAP